MLHVAILGLGEAGGAFARDLMGAGVRVSGWDPLPDRRPQGIVAASDNAGAAEGADVILSMNLASAALEVAAEVAPMLREGQVYAEANTASPGLKREAASLIEARGARFADVAIMAPVPPLGMRSPLWVAGSGAAAFDRHLAPLGLDVTVLDGEAGAAATRKLIRSIAYKGFAAVAMECLAAARKLDLEAYAREQIATLVDEETIDRFEAGSRAHARRRIHEMDAVAELLRSIDVEPRLARAARDALADLQAATGEE